MAISTIAVASVVTAAAATTEGVMNYEASQRAADAAKSLKNEQASALAAEQTTAAQQAAAQAITGQTFGGQRMGEDASTGLGFGTTKAPTGAGRAALTGMN